MSLHERQSVPGDSGTVYSDNDGYSWWWSDTGYAVRYAIIASLFGSAFLYLLIGYIHARRRVKKGLQPLAYHRWMIRRPHAYPPPGAAYYYPYSPQQAYPMNEYPAPPPAYHQAYAAPPTYQPPQGGSKVMPDQHYGPPPPPPQMSGAQQGESSGVTPPPPARH